MREQFNNHEPSGRAQLSALSRLGLTDDELAALTRQGFVRREQRGHKSVFRLRYRYQGRQRSRYVAARDAAAIATELSRLQKQVRARRNLAEVARLARKMLRARKRFLAPLLEVRGYYLHGQQVRQRRPALDN